MKRKIILLCMLLALFAQIRLSQKAITSKLLQKDLKGLTIGPIEKEPFLSLGSVRAAIIRNKISELVDKKSLADRQTHLILINHRISKK